LLVPPLYHIPGTNQEALDPAAGGRKECFLSEITVKDLFEGAWLLTKGHSLDKVTVEGMNGKTHCLFVFTGPDVDKAARAYRSGDANVNVVRLKFAMETIKDRMFSSLRRHNKAHSAGHSGRKGKPYARKDRYQVTY